MGHSCRNLGLVRIVQIQILEEGERLLARPEGPMDACDGIAFASAVQERLHAGIKFVTIDLEALDFISFGGIRGILRLARSLIGRQTDVDFLRGNAAVREALDQAGLDDFFPFTPPYVSTRGVQRWSVVSSSRR